MNIFVKIKAYFKLEKAITLAENASKSTGLRYFVLPALDKSLIVVSRNSFRHMKRKGYIPKTANMLDVKKECFYYTGDARGNTPPDKEEQKYRREMYYNFVARARKKKK